MCQNEKGDSNVVETFSNLVENVEGILEREWGIKKCYVLKWKQ